MDGLFDAAAALATFRAEPTVYLVHLAMLAYAGGFLFRSQVWLRSFVLVGTALYIAYYVFHPATPLWDAIFASGVIGLANAVGLVGLMLDRVPFAMSEARPLYDAFQSISPGTIKPGRVRALMRRAVVNDMADATTLIQAGMAPGAVHFMLEGEAEIRKGGSRHAVRAPGFLGEIAFITGGVASADVSVAAGSRVVSWPAGTLRQMMRANGELDTALRALISYDIARKLAVSVPTALTAPWAVEADPPAMPASGSKPCDADLFEPNGFGEHAPFPTRADDDANATRAGRLLAS